MSPPAKPPRRRRPTPILSEAEISIVRAMVEQSVSSPLLATARVLGLSLDDALAYASVKDELIAEREARGITLKQAASSLRVPRHRVSAIEAGRLGEIDPKVFTRYVEWLGATRWFARWKKAQPALAARLLGEPAPPEPAWIGRPADFIETASGPAPSARTRRDLDEARSRYGDACRFRVALRGIEPPIWRRFVVPEAMTLHELHLVLQEVMGWTNTHLYEFSNGHATFTEPDVDDVHEGRFIHDSRIVLLGDLRMWPGMKLTYRYDFGDGWTHDVQLESSDTPGQAAVLPTCIAGARACPPEDVGGVGGYEDILAQFAGPKAARRGVLRQFGGDFDPEAFEPGAADRLLRREQARWRRWRGLSRSAREPR